MNLLIMFHPSTHCRSVSKKYGFIDISVGKVMRKTMFKSFDRLAKGMSLWEVKGDKPSKEELADRNEPNSQRVKRVSSEDIFIFVCSIYLMRWLVIED